MPRHICYLSYFKQEYILSWVEYLQGLGSCYLLRGPILKGSLTTGRAVKAPAGSPGKYGVRIIAEKENKEALIAGEVLGGEK